MHFIGIRVSRVACPRSDGDGFAKVVWEGSVSTEGCEGQIVFLPTPRSVMGTLDPVYIDRGSKHGLHPGSELEVVEGGRAVQDAVRRSSVKTPTRVIGGMVILATQEESALAVVTHARRELERGDAVRSLPPEEVAGL